MHRISDIDVIGTTPLSNLHLIAWSTSVPLSTHRAGRDVAVPGARFNADEGQFPQVLCGAGEAVAGDPHQNWAREEARRQRETVAEGFGDS